MNPSRKSCSDPAADDTAAKVGVVDIGSNSVRLVVYRGDGRVPTPIFNERVLCGLGRGLVATGMLHKNGARLALETARRFTQLAREMKVPKIHIVATAAVREASNGAEFAAEIKAACDHPVSILSGDEEAQLAAFGVVAGIPDSNGIVGDMGGGSLELAEVNGNGKGQRASLPVGPLRLLDMATGKSARREAVREIRRYLSCHDWLAGGRGRQFYAIGGAWRVVAQAHMEQRGYPLRILHEYRIPGGEFRKFAGVIADMNEWTLSRFTSVPAERRDTLALAALVLEKTLNTVRPSEVVISAFGIREGILFAAMDGERRRRDPLIEQCRQIANQQGRFREHGDALFDWIEPLFAEADSAESRLRRAACLLSDIAWRGHPDYRAELALSQVLQGQFVGIDHGGRALLALTLFVCYGGALTSDSTMIARSLLDPGRITVALRIGAALRLAQRISGGTRGFLDQCRLEKTKNSLVLHVAEQSQHLIGKVARNRLEYLGRISNKKTRIILE